MINIYVIGCGGIGGYLIELLPMALAGLSLDLLDKGQYSVQELLMDAGTKSIPCIADSIVLVDGDTFNARNALRQGGGAGSKLEQRMHEVRDKLRSLMRKTGARHSILFSSWLQNLRVIGYNNYINPSNMSQIIPRVPEVNTFNDSAPAAFSRALKGKLNTPVVFLCVDNKKTRYEVSKYMESFDDCIVINGGNRKTAGQVTVYERSNGVALDPAIYEVFPDVTATADKRPDELECTAVAPEHDQIANTNAIIADWMSIVFNNWIRYGLTRKVGAAVTRTNEVIIDTESYTTMGLYHPITKRGITNEQEGTEGTGAGSEPGTREEAGAEDRPAGEEGCTSNEGQEGSGAQEAGIQEGASEETGAQETGAQETGAQETGA